MLHPRACEPTRDVESRVNLEFHNSESVLAMHKLMCGSKGRNQGKKKLVAAPHCDPNLGCKCFHTYR